MPARYSTFTICTCGENGGKYGENLMLYVECGPNTTFVCKIEWWLLCFLTKTECCRSNVVPFCPFMIVHVLWHRIDQFYGSLSSKQNLISWCPLCQWQRQKIWYDLIPQISIKEAVILISIASKKWSSFTSLAIADEGKFDWFFVRLDWLDGRPSW